MVPRELRRLDPFPGLFPKARVDRSETLPVCTGCADTRKLQVLGAIRCFQSVYDEFTCIQPSLFTHLRLDTLAPVVTLGFKDRWH
jgi:hypothetical protein